ncbi:hypothetical protein E2542_SST24579 [Spatholobus suberectus]|nr:hypothetical protein E2542_SST24579 [Spatholobus suberectus]
MEKIRLCRFSHSSFTLSLTISLLISNSSHPLSLSSPIHGNGRSPSSSPSPPSSASTSVRHERSQAGGEWAEAGPQLPLHAAPPHGGAFPRPPESDTLGLSPTTLRGYDVRS